MGAPEERTDLLDLLFEASNEGMVDWDIVGNQAHYNERWRFLLGWDEDGFDVSIDTWRGLIHPEDRPRVDQAITEHLEQGWPLFQTVRMRHRSMGWRWILMRGAARSNEQGQAVRMVITFADVDERVRAEAQMRALVEAIPDTIVRVRSDGTVLAIKEGNRLEYSHGDSDSLARGLFAALQTSEAGARLMDAIRVAGEHEDVVQIQCRLGPSREAPADYDVRVVRSGGDEAICIVRDVTKEKSAEEQLARGKKVEAIGRLAAGLAHEINTPLQYIGDNLHFAKDAVTPLLALLDDYRKVVQTGKPASTEVMATLGAKEEAVELPYLRESLATIIGNGLDGMEQIARIVRAMKTFEDVGRQERTNVDLNAIVENATVVASHFWNPVAELSMRLADDLPAVPCVANEIAQVVMNLLVNAAQAITDKIGKSGTNCKKGKISIETLRRPDTDSVEIRVTDDGVGIPEAIRGNIFDPFFTTRQVGQGSGQGLAQVHFVVVRVHGGTIDFDSREGEWTRFSVSLPLTVPDQR